MDPSFASAAEQLREAQLGLDTALRTAVITALRTAFYGPYACVRTYEPYGRIRSYTYRLYRPNAVYERIRMGNRKKFRIRIIPHRKIPQMDAYV